MGTKKLKNPENPSDIYKKCTLTITPCIWVRFKGDSTNISFPELPKDGGLVGEFLKWSLDKNIIPIEGTPGTTGPGVISHAYCEKDMPKIIEWFKNKSVKIVMGH